MKGSSTITTIDCEICILAGGLSSRMGRDKGQLRIGRRPMLAHIRKIAESSGLPVRVIRRDKIKRCGPLGGVFTALKTTNAAAVLFLACDMPFIRLELLQALLTKLTSRTPAVFAKSEDKAGFPFVLRRSLLQVVEQQIARKIYLLNGLVSAVSAEVFTLPRSEHEMLFNINTPEDWTEAQKTFGNLGKKASA